jgi:hypothetical protein
MNCTIMKKSAHQMPFSFHVVSHNTQCDLINKNKKVGRGKGYNFYEHLWTHTMNDINFDHHKGSLCIHNLRYTSTAETKRVYPHGITVSMRTLLLLSIILLDQVAAKMEIY